MWYQTVNRFELIMFKFLHLLSLGSNSKLDGQYYKQFVEVASGSATCLQLMPSCMQVPVSMPLPNTLILRLDKRRQSAIKKMWLNVFNWDLPAKVTRFWIRCSVKKFLDPLPEDSSKNIFVHLMKHKKKNCTTSEIQMYTLVMIKNDCQWPKKLKKNSGHFFFRQLRVEQN